MSNTEKGGAADLKAQRAAAVLAVDFQTNAAADLLRAMSQANSDSNTAKASKDEASIAFCAFAAEMVRTELDRDQGCQDRAVITEGFCRHLDTLRPMLAAEGSVLVDVKTEDGKDTVYSWKGHGANVKSIAKGVTEFIDTDTEIVEPADAESFTEIKKSVQVARQSGEDDDARELREAKEEYREVEAAIRKMILGQKTARDVRALTEELQVAADTITMLVTPVEQEQSELDEDGIEEQSEQESEAA